ncbi:sodium:solute symporter [Thraustotheca clavata]|uniref:Sodium:solute symporter n=1 Tax=Thraustotheca clavata TaxID=74557 RepID=A0A1V9Y6K9_9STRA|nr:sodium:solute symporter [Thraustotheca clavata]
MEDTESPHLSALDGGICIAYLVSVLIVGTIATWISRRKEQTINDYYLGGRRLPWWALAIADVSSYIDIAGTMINTALIYALGVRGIFVEVRGGLCLFLGFQLAFTGKLVRRCPVRTKGEWILYRFGDSLSGRIARTLVAVVSLIGGVMGVTYFSIGGGKFVTEFVSIPSYWGLPSDFWASGGLMLIALCYTIIAGFTSMVLTDVYQSIFIFGSFIIVSILGFKATLPSTFHIFLPTYSTSNSTNFLNYTMTQANWSSATWKMNLHLPEESTYSMYNNFTPVIMLYLVLVCVRSASGPGGGGLQTVLATKTEREVRSQTFLAMILLLFRWGFSGGICVLAICYSTAHPDVIIDPERVVPFVLANVLPTGIQGLVLASLLAAALTTFDSTINSTSSYWTIDIYQALLNPEASTTQLLWQARLSTLVILISGWCLSLQIHTINRVWGFMVVAMSGGTVYPYFLSWYWSRFNAFGCATGIFCGVLTAMIAFFGFPHIAEYECFLWSSSISGVVAVIACMCTSPTNGRTLRIFYKSVRPPGFWTTIGDTCLGPIERRETLRENRKDLLCAGLIMIVQVATYIFAVSIVIKAWTQCLILGLILVILSPIIYTQWYLKLNNELPKHEPLLGEETQDEGDDL